MELKCEIQEKAVYHNGVDGLIGVCECQSLNVEGIPEISHREWLAG